MEHQRTLGASLREEERVPPAGWGAPALAVVALLVGGCTPRPLVVRAIDARGGSLHGFVRQSEAEVHADFAAGTWRWRTAFLAPDRYAWTIFTTREPNHYLFDGAGVRLFMGDREVAAGANQETQLRTHARFTAVANLDFLRLPGVRVEPLAAAELPAGTTSGLVVVLPDDGARYRLAFDARALLVWLTGPVDLWPLGRGEVVARFDDFRRVRGFVLPFLTTYTFADAPLADERALAVCPDDPGLAPAAFEIPARLPECPQR